MRRGLGAVVLVWLCAAPSAHAQSFGGGGLSRAGVATASVYVYQGGRPTAGARTRIRCGRQFYDVGGSSYAKRDGGRIRGGGQGSVPLGKGRRVRYRWQLNADLTDQTGRGTVLATGRLGRKRCGTTRVPVRLKPNESYPKLGAPVVPKAGQFFDGIGNGAGGMVIKAQPGGRVRAAWYASLGCIFSDKPLPFLYVTKPLRVGADGRFSEKRFIRFQRPGLRFRYRVITRGRFADNKAMGEYSVRLDIDVANSALDYDCQDGHEWWAVRRDAYVPPTDSGEAPEPRNWSLTYTDSAGKTGAFGATELLSVTGNREQMVLTMSRPEFWQLRLRAGFGAGFVAGQTYRNVALTAPGVDCNDPVGSFTVKRAAFDLFGRPQAFDVDFAQECGQFVPAVRGNWAFRR